MVIEPDAIDYKTGSLLRIWLKTRRSDERFVDWIGRLAFMAELHGKPQQDGSFVLDPVTVTLRREGAQIVVTAFHCVPASIQQMTETQSSSSLRAPQHISAVQAHPVHHG